MVKAWTSDFWNTPDPDYDIIDIQHDGKDVATIKKDHKNNGELIIEWRKSEKELTIPFDWFLDLLQDAKEKFTGAEKKL
jgi:hypothetical protein